MTTTVGRLLDDVHARAWDLCSELHDREPRVHEPDRAAELLAAWPRLATSALRVLDAVPLEPAWLDDMGSVRLLLGEVRRGLLPGSEDGPGAARPDPALVDMATRIGLIADLLAGERPARTDVDRAAVEGLHLEAIGVLAAQPPTRWEPGLHDLAEQASIPIRYLRTALKDHVRAWNQDARRASAIQIGHIRDVMQRLGPTASHKTPEPIRRVPATVERIPIASPTPPRVGHRR